MAESEMMSVLDYILNRCSPKELDAVEAAVKRRRADMTAGGTPFQFAKNVSKIVNNSIAASIGGLSESIRDMARNLVRKESPNLAADEVEYIVSQMVPDVFAAKKSEAASALREGRSLVRDGKVNGFPVAAMREMVAAFINYSLGTLAPEEDRALRNAFGGEWLPKYWNAFPPELRSLISAYLKKGLPDEAFQSAAAVLLPDPDAGTNAE